MALRLQLLKQVWKTDEDEPDDETKVIHAHTMAEAVYSDESVGPLIIAKKKDLTERMQTRIEHQEGSGWLIKRINGFFVTTYTQTPSRSSSFIPTPEPLKNSKLGLINIKNEDNECFKYCLLYHQSEKGKNGERVSVLKKVVDKYKWDGVGFPVGFNDITTFENNNKVRINIYGSECYEEINPLRLGNIA